MTTIETHGDHFALAWKESEHGSFGQTLRNRYAKQLRASGYIVKTKTVDFTDLARDRIFRLEAHTPSASKSPFGVETIYVHPR